MTQEDKKLLLKAIEQKRQEVRPTDTGEMKPATVPNNLELGWLNALEWMKKHINSLPAEEEQPSEDSKDPKNDSNHSETLYTYEQINILANNRAQWQKEQTINKASKWLADNVIHYIWKSSKGEIGISDDFFIDFEKVMEEKKIK